jgi:8-oxo-dGTP diphosphatase
VEDCPAHAIRIAAALIDDGAGRILLVRKRGTRWFMQAGGKIEDGEDAVTALRRELREEIGLASFDIGVDYLGQYAAAAANERDCVVCAEVFHVRVAFKPETKMEIEEAVWVSLAEAETMPLAPLTRGHILTLARTIAS